MTERGPRRGRLPTAALEEVLATILAAVDRIPPEVLRECLAEKQKESA